MAFDELAALQRAKQMEQQAAINGGRLTLKRISDKIDIILMVGFFILLIPTYGVSFLLVLFFWWRYFFGKKIYVKNIATYEKFYISRTDWKKYKKVRRESNTETRKLDL